MAKYRKKPAVVEAAQWWENGDHPEVRYYTGPVDSREGLCGKCGCTLHLHGWTDTLEGGYIVCVGDWIITGVEGEKFPCKDYIFKLTYELVEPGESESDDS